jgi:hypothetical protein
VLSLGGPAGWATLAAGAAIYAASLVAIEGMTANIAIKTASAAKGMRGMMSEEDVGGGVVANPGWLRNRKTAFSSLEEATQRARDPLFELHAQLAKVDEQFAALKIKMTPEAAAQLAFIKQDIIDRASGFTTKLEAVNEEIRILEGTATEASIALEKMGKAGISPEKIKQLDEAMKTRDQVKSNKAYWDDIKKQGAAVTEALKTPQQKLADEVQRLKNLRAVGGIKDDETLNAAIAEAQRKAGGRSGGAAAFAEQGSQSAYSTIARAMGMTDKQDIEKASLDTEKQMLAEVKLLRKDNALIAAREPVAWRFSR